MSDISQAIALLEKVSDRLDRIERRLEEANSAVPVSGLLTREQAAKVLNVSPRTISREYKKYWIEGVHYFAQSKGDRFNQDLIVDWQANHISNPAAHQQAIELWAKKQSANQRKRR